VIAMRERQRLGRLLDDPVAAHQSLERAVGAPRDRCREPQQARLARHVELPADPDHREVQTRQQAIAEVGVRRGITAPRRAIEVRQQRLAAPIAHLEQRDRSARRRTPRPQHHEVGGRLDAAARVAGRAVEIHDERVRGMRRVELQLDGAGELFVLAAEHVLTRAHDDPPYLGAGVGGAGEDEDEGGQRRAAPHRAR
jgi:hypothetical protein